MWAIPCGDSEGPRGQEEGTSHQGESILSADALATPFSDELPTSGTPHTEQLQAIPEQVGLWGCKNNTQLPVGSSGGFLDGSGGLWKHQE